MRVIVSNTLEDSFRGYKVVRKIKDILQQKPEDLECVILHSWEDVDFNAGIGISKLHSEGVKRFFYISATPVPTMQMVIQGVNGVCVNDEFYFEDEDELDVLVHDDLADETTELMVSKSSLCTIKDFIQAFARNEERIKAPFYLEQVSEAVNELSVLTQRQELQIKDMGTSAVAVFERANDIITSMNKMKDELTERLNTLISTGSGTQSPRDNFGSGISIFPPCAYTGTAKVLVIHEMSHCRYLTSFVLAYLHYLQYMKNKRAKLILVHQKGSGVLKKYNSFTTITQESVHNQSLYDSPVVATNNPKSDVMKQLMHKNDNVIIVVDRLYSNEPILKGRVKLLHAVSGTSDLDRYKVKPDSCIFSTVNHPSGFFAISHIKNYPSDPDSRHAAYMTVFLKTFKKLDKYLEL